MVAPFRFNISIVTIYSVVILLPFLSGVAEQVLVTINCIVMLQYSILCSHWAKRQTAVCIIQVFLSSFKLFSGLGHFSLVDSSKHVSKVFKNEDRRASCQKENAKIQ